MVPADPQLLLHRQFEEQARKTPEHVALHEGQRTITYGDLEKRSNQVAAALRSRGIREGSMVGLYLERSIGWVISVLAILKANAAVIPLPPSYPRNRLREILDHASIETIIDDAETPLDQSLAARVISLAELYSEVIAKEDTLQGRLDQPAFVLCSSGSTGRPKMIVRSHGSFLHRLEWTWENHPYEAGEICCQKAHATTTHGIYELFEPLLRGIPVVIIADEDVRNLERFWDIVKTRRISRLLIVPSALHASLEMPDFEAPPINVLVLMGEYVHPELAKRAIAEFPAQTHLYSIYGSTEASSTLVCDLRESYHSGEDLPLGKPISSKVQAMVLGPGLEPVVPGELGQLYLAGTALFTEYLGDPDLTASVFVEAPGHGEPLYDSHDQVRLLPDGNLQFIGRVDHTVKIRGFRVDLQEVERTLLLNPDVRRAAVVVGGDEKTGANLLAFVIPETINQSSVYETLRSRLPNYMIPSVLLGVEEFPYTASGKLDRVRLLEEQVERAPDHAPDRDLSDTESKVWEIWGETLGHRGFALDSSFFEVGGTSLTVFALVHRLRKTFALKRNQLTEQFVYSFPSIDLLAECIDDIRSGRPPTAIRNTPLLVTLRKGRDAAQAPFFVVASAGGTLGAYEKLAAVLTTTREVVGVRDPFVWGERDPTEGFQRWIGRYLEAIRERQPCGPYYLGAYSSAGAFGLEIAHQLSEEGEDVVLLALIDPLALDRRNRLRYGWWALEATYSHPAVRALVRLAGHIRVPVLRGLRVIYRSVTPNDYKMSDEEFRKASENALRSKRHLMTFAALLELNTGLPFTLSEEDFSKKEPDQFFAVLQARIKKLMPQVEAENIERIVVQYSLQISMQHAYVLQPYGGQVRLFEPETRYAGLLGAQMRPYLSDLRVRALKLGEPSQRTRVITERFGPLQPHYRSMRDDLFVQELARELDALLA